MKKTTDKLYPKPKKLFRSERDKIVGGVAGGVGEYLNIDPNIVRIVFILFAFLGIGIIIYLILWIVVPSESNLEKTESENIKENIKSIFKEIKKFAETLVGQEKKMPETKKIKENEDKTACKVEIVPQPSKEEKSEGINSLKIIVSIIFIIIGLIGAIISGFTLAIYGIPGISLPILILLGIVLILLYILIR